MHGTLWVKIHVVEELRKLEDSTLIPKQKYDKEKLDEPNKKPFKGITKAYHKFRNEHIILKNFQMARS